MKEIEDEKLDTILERMAEFIQAIDKGVVLMTAIYRFFLSLKEEK